MEFRIYEDTVFQVDFTKAFGKFLHWKYLNPYFSWCRRLHEEYTTCLVEIIQTIASQFQKFYLPIYITKIE